MMVITSTTTQLTSAPLNIVIVAKPDSKMQNGFLKMAPTRRDYAANKHRCFKF
jgi:hypothetical protein